MAMPTFHSSQHMMQEIRDERNRIHFDPIGLLPDVPLQFMLAVLLWAITVTVVIISSLPAINHGWLRLSKFSTSILDLHVYVLTAYKANYTAIILYEMPIRIR